MAQGIKTGGREAGTPNKLTKELREILKDLLHRELTALPERLEKLDGKERLEILVKLLPYVLPKVEPVSMDNGEPGVWDF